MAIIFEEKNRNVIPRWRNSSVALLTNEFDSLKESKNQNIGDDFLNEKKKLWSEKQNLASAAELVYSSFIYRNYNVAKEAAKFILSNKENLPPQILHIARQIISENELISVPIFPDNIIDYSVTHNRIRILKERIKLDPRNGIARIDIAREYTIIGEYKKAFKNILIAISLNHENRFILRSSSRFFIHFGEASLATSLLNESRRLIEDPWLLAAEIASSSVLNLSSKHFKTGLKLLESGKFPPYQLSELAAALGAHEFYFGNLKKAKRLFKTAKIAPTENAIAQIIWTFNQLGIKDLELESIQMAHLYEAFARINFEKGNWISAVNDSIRWFNDQPFSKRPAYFISYTSSALLEDYTTSIKICKAALEANHNDFTLLNNLSFSYASKNEPKDAEIYFHKIDYNKLDINQKIVYNATQGLINLRNNLFNEGNYFYKTAIDLANKNRITRYALIASLYLLREQVIARVSSDLTLEKILSQYVKSQSELKEPELRQRINNLQKILNEK